MGASDSKYIKLLIRDRIFHSNINKIIEIVESSMIGLNCIELIFSPLNYTPIFDICQEVKDLK